MMKVLIDDGMQIQIGTGIGKYSLYLYNELKKFKFKGIETNLVEFDKSNFSKKQARIKYLYYINSKDYVEKSKQYDVIHYTNYVLPFRRNKKSKYVVTIHDLASFLYPESLPLMYKFYNRYVIKYAIKHADKVLTVSESVKREILALWPQYKDKVYVAYPGLYSEFGKKKSELSKMNMRFENSLLSKQLESQKYFLFIGTIEKRKNIGIIIDAFLKLKDIGLASNYKLVLAGRFGFGFEEFKTKIEKSQYAKDIIVPGYISTTDCKILYTNAVAYIFPSIYEGFGSTQLECMVNHLPLILSDIPTNREVSIGYGLFFELGDVAGLMKQMMALVDNTYSYVDRNVVADKILEKFQWDKLVNTYIDVYDKL